MAKWSLFVSCFVVWQLVPHLKNLLQQMKLPNICGVFCALNNLYVMKFYVGSRIIDL